MGQKGDYVMLEVKNLTFQVQENGVERSIVENISFDVADGEMLVITGPNGGGKSTLAKVLMGIEKASAGQIILDGEDISNYDINHRADAGIGYAFQQPPRFKGMTVMKLLSLSAGKELKREECCKLLSTVGLCANEYIEREVDGTLSGGEMKRLEIATVLAKSHKLCIFNSHFRMSQNFNIRHSKNNIFWKFGCFGSFSFAIFQIYTHKTPFFSL